MAGGQEGYYLDSVARGAEEYYLGAGEARGVWLGRLADELGLAGEVSAEQLRAILDDRHPFDGARLGRSRNRRTHGFDACFKAPKSVSLLWALGEPGVAGLVRDAHDAAVAAAFAYLEREVAWSRTGQNGVDVVVGDGLVAGAFRHRTSRAGDPHLHTHVLIANSVRCADGLWRSLDGRRLFAHSLTAGYLYQAQLRHELTRRLGLAWGPVVNGCADLNIIPAHVREAFSTRRREVEEVLEATGWTSARAAQIATLATRAAKDTAPDLPDLVARWRAHSAELGFDPAALTHGLGQAEIGPIDVAAVTRGLLSAEGLTRSASTFDRQAVLRAWCGQLPAGANVVDVEALADGFLTGPALVPLSRPGPVIRARSGRLLSRLEDIPAWTTAELHALESRLVAGALTRRRDRCAVVPTAVLEQAVVGNRHLSLEQVRVVTGLSTSGAGVDVVVAGAGTGKTLCLGAAAQAWTAAGHRVIGACLAARAARELTATAGIPSTTLAALTGDLGAVTPASVVVVDEAGMAGTRQLAPLLDRAAAVGAKVVLVGDPHQLPEITAGGLLTGLALRLGPHTLVENRRQREGWSAPPCASCATAMSGRR